MGATCRESFSFTSTVTAGIVSAKARGMQSAPAQWQDGHRGYIQTDATVNPATQGAPW